MTVSGIKTIRYKNSEIFLFENDRVIYGYCLKNCSSELLSEYFNLEFRELDQIHSNIIFDWNGIGINDRGDGIIIAEKGEGAIIRTADCIPLFFYSGRGDIGGIIHAGWRGFYAGIEKRLAERLKELNIDLNFVNFIAGPHIEGKCYEVGSDLYEKFSENPDRDKIFTKRGEKYYLDIFNGLKLSLVKKSVPEENISDMELCTFCSPQNLPSYRKNKTKERIYNFIFLR